MPNVSRNSIEYNLTNKLFKNCKKRFIIDINDSDDVQITSCFETKNDKHVLVNLDDNCSSPKELKYKLNKGTKGKLQFRTYNLNRKDEHLRQAVADLFDDNMATAQLSRQTNYLTGNRSPKFYENSPNHHSQRQTRSTSAENQVQTRSRSRDRSDRNNKINKSNSYGSVGRSKKVAANKATTKKRSRSADYESDEEQSTKRKKVTYKKRATNAGKKTTSSSKNSKATKPKKLQRKANPRPRKKENDESDKQRANQQVFELIDLLESSVESENANESSSLINSDNQIDTDFIASSANDSTNNFHSQQSPTQSTQSLDTEMLARYLASNIIEHQNNQNQNSQNSQQQTLDHIAPAVETANTSNTPSPSNRSETSELFQKYLEYQELENRVNRLKEQNAAEINNRRTAALNASALKNKQDREKKASAVYHLDDNLVIVDNKLGLKHLITCLTIIAVGELIHYLQPKASLNYNQLPVGCLLISNLISSVQFTMLGHLLFVVINLAAPKLFSIFRTSSRLICYCLLLFLSYGMLRKSITNWILNNNRLIRLFPLNVSICCSMLILYSVIALYLSTDGNRIVKARKSSNEDLSDGGDSIETNRKHNWFNVIVNIMTPYFVIGPIIGTNTVRLYNVPKPLLAVSALIYLYGLYKYCVGRLERNPSAKNQKVMVYELKDDSYLFSSSSRVRYLTLFGALLMITAYNLLVLNLWSFLLELFVLVYLKLRTYYLDNQFAKLNKSVYTRYRNNNPYLFNSWIH